MTNSIKINKNDVLVVVDLQNDFFSKATGTLYVPGAESLLLTVPILMAEFHDVGAQIVLTQDWHPEKHISFASTHNKDPYSVIDVSYGEQVLWPDHCVQGTHGAEFCEFIPTNRATTIIRKGWRKNIDSYSAVQENDKETLTGLDSMLTATEVDRIFVCGLALDFCIGATARDLFSFTQLPVFIVEDATAAVFPDKVEAIPNIEYVRSDQISR